MKSLSFWQTTPGKKIFTATFARDLFFFVAFIRFLSLSKVFKESVVIVAKILLSIERELMCARVTLDFLKLFIILSVLLGSC